MERLCAKAKSAGFCEELGEWYGEGRQGIPPNPAMSFSFFLIGCEQKNAESCRRVADYYAHGKDLARAKYYYQLSCSLDSRNDCGFLKTDPLFQQK